MADSASSFSVSLYHWRGQPRKVSVAESEARRRERVSLARQPAAETIKCRREERGDDYCERQRYSSQRGRGVADE